MHNKELAAILGLLGFFIAVAIYALPQAVITGDVVLVEQAPPTFTGLYSISPNFKVDFDYDFSIYQKIAGDLDIISACVDLGASLETCMRNIAQTKEMLWETDCDKGVQRLFYDIAQLYDDCAASAETNCLCMKDFGAQGYVAKGELKGAYAFSLQKTNDGKGIALSDKGEKFSHTIETSAATDLPFELSFSYGDAAELRKQINEKVVVTALAREEKSPELLLYKAQGGQGSTLSFVFDDEGKLRKPSGDLLTDANNQFITKQNAPLCRKKPTTIQRFCVTDSKRTVLAYDAVDGEVKRRPIVIRFAAYMQDTPPSPVQNLKAEDFPRAEKSLIVSWDESTSGDVASYTVYQASSEDAFKGQTSTFKDKSTPITYKVSQKKQLASTIDLRICTFSLEKKACLFSGEKLEKNTLHSMPNANGKQTLFVAVPVDEDGKDYWFAVTAVDQNGNEADNVKPKQKVALASKASLDDLPLRSEGIVPLPVNAANNYNKQTQTFTFSNFVMPSLNADGNPATGYKDAVLLYKKKDADMPADATLAYFDGEIPLNPQPGAPLSIPFATEPSSVYYVAMVARDNANNPQKTLTPADIGATVLELPVT